MPHPHPLLSIFPVTVNNSTIWSVFFFFISLLVHVKGLWVYFIPDVFPQPAYLKKSRIIFEHNFGASKQNKYPNCLWVSKLQVLPWWREVQKTEAKKAVSEASEADPVGWPIIPFFLFHFVGIVMDKMFVSLPIHVWNP